MSCSGLRPSQLTAPKTYTTPGDITPAERKTLSARLPKAQAWRQRPGRDAALAAWRGIRHREQRHKIVMHDKGENYLKAALWLAAQKHGSKVDIPAAQGGFWGVQQRDVWGSLWESWRS
ncbi:MAG: hypothetical protein ACOY44_01570 [Pseudomonadota bacterium]